jgi:hypothetical protein
MQRANADTTPFVGHGARSERAHQPRSEAHYPTLALSDYASIVFFASGLVAGPSSTAPSTPNREP